MVGDERLKRIGKVCEAAGKFGGAIGLELAVGDMAETIAVGLDQPPAGGAEPRVEAEDSQPSLSSSSSGIFSLPQTVWTSSSSSSASISFISC